MHATHVIEQHGKYRHITNHSAAGKYSLNYMISFTERSLKLDGIQNLGRAFRRARAALNPTTKLTLIKVDVSGAYRHIPMNPSGNYIDRSAVVRRVVFSVAYILWYSGLLSKATLSYTRRWISKDTSSILVGFEALDLGLSLAEKMTPSNPCGATEPVRFTSAQSVASVLQCLSLVKFLLPPTN